MLDNRGVFCFKLNIYIYIRMRTLNTFRGIYDSNSPTFSDSDSEQSGVFYSMERGVMKQRIVILIVLISFTIGLSSCESIFVCNSSQLLSILNSLHYEYYGPYADWGLPISEDIQIIGTVTISSEQLEVPEECANRLDCRDQVGFADVYGADGISLTPIPPNDGLYPPASLTLTNVKLRLRPLFIDTHPMEFNYVPVIQLMPPSDHECEGSQIRCEMDQVCYDSYLSYCKSCLDFSQYKCVCRDENGILPDGTECMIMLSNDSFMIGECQDGECITECDL